MRRFFVGGVLYLGILVFLLAGCSTEGSPAQVASAGPEPPVATPVNTPTSTESPANDPNELTPAELSGELAKYLINGDKTTNVARAQAELFQEGLRFYLIIVSAKSTGLEGEIYQDLIKRNFRATTGPDEGFDTQSLECHPNCVFVPAEVANALSVPSWKNVLKHEQRHMVQAANNPDMAREFRRTEESLFTTYAAFLEACADDGIFVGEEVYHASERMPKLKQVIGAENKTLLERACEGFPDAYQTIGTQYEAKQGAGSFAKLFPPYK
jgi:hypothetical protein